MQLAANPIKKLKGTFSSHPVSTGLQKAKNKIN